LERVSRRIERLINARKINLEGRAFANLTLNADM
jgi:hypothetical protein